MSVSIVVQERCIGDDAGRVPRTFRRRLCMGTESGMELAGLPLCPVDLPESPLSHRGSAQETAPSGALGEGRKENGFCAGAPIGPEGQAPGKSEARDFHRGK